MNTKPAEFNKAKISKIMEEKRRREEERQRIEQMIERLRKRKEKNEHIRRQRLEQKKIINNIKELLKKIWKLEKYYKKKYKRIDNGRTKRLITDVASAIRKVIKS